MPRTRAQVGRASKISKSQSARSSNSRNVDVATAAAKPQRPARQTQRNRANATQTRSTREPAKSKACKVVSKSKRRQTKLTVSQDSSNSDFQADVPKKRSRRGKNKVTDNTKQTLNNRNCVTKDTEERERSKGKFCISRKHENIQKKKDKSKAIREKKCKSDVTSSCGEGTKSADVITSCVHVTHSKEDHTYCASPEYKPNVVFETKSSKTKNSAGSRQGSVLKGTSCKKTSQPCDPSDTDSDFCSSLHGKRRSSPRKRKICTAPVEAPVAKKPPRRGTVTRHPILLSQRINSSKKTRAAALNSSTELADKDVRKQTELSDESELTDSKRKEVIKEGIGEIAERSKSMDAVSVDIDIPLSVQDTVYLDDLEEDVKAKRRKFDISLLKSSCESIYKKETSCTPASWLEHNTRVRIEKISQLKFSGLSDLWIEGLSFSSEGHLVVATGYNLYVCDLETKSKVMLGDSDDRGAGFLEGPGDVVVLRNGDIAVTDSLANDVKIYNKTTGAYVKSIAGDTSPTGIAQNRQSEIVVVDNLHESQELCSVLTFSASGELLRTVDNDGDIKYFDFPLYVTTNSADDVIISDCIGRHVSAFSSQGNLLFKCTGSTPDGSTDECRFLYPCGVCTDEDDGILVVDRYGHCVHRITRHGQYDRLVATSSDGLVDPRSIALDRKSGTLAVGNENGSVLLFRYTQMDLI